MPVGEPELRSGASGDAVRRLQQALSRAGFDPGTIDGAFGARTDAAVRAFQGALGLTVDGIVGPATWAALCIPAYAPAGWNDGGTVQGNNNCYNYATDLRTDTFAQPGRAAGASITMDCVSVDAGARADGLQAGSCDAGGCTECCHQVALVIWPGVDFHWYRKAEDGTWSHKPGSTPARNYDNGGAPITDPRTAARGPYTVFCGCYCVCKPDVTIG